MNALRTSDIACEIARILGFEANLPNPSIITFTVDNGITVNGEHIDVDKSKAYLELCCALNIKDRCHHTLTIELCEDCIVEVSGAFFAQGDNNE